MGTKRARLRKGIRQTIMPRGDLVTISGHERYAIGPMTLFRELLSIDTRGCRAIRISAISLDGPGGAWTDLSIQCSYEGVRGVDATLTTINVVGLSTVVEYPGDEVRLLLSNNNPAGANVAVAWQLYPHAVFVEEPAEGNR